MVRPAGRQERNRLSRDRLWLRPDVERMSSVCVCTYSLPTVFRGNFLKAMRLSGGFVGVRESGGEA